MAIATQDSTTTKANLTEARLNTLITRLTQSGGVTIGHGITDSDTIQGAYDDSDSDGALTGQSSTWELAAQNRINHLITDHNLLNNDAIATKNRANNLITDYNDLVSRFNALVDALAAAGIING